MERLRIETEEVPELITVGSVSIGRRAPVVVIAGMCAVESREQALATAVGVARGGACMLRGGAYKPRTSPYTFQGLGRDGLRLLVEARAVTGLPVVTEAVDAASLASVAELGDVVQIGARNMANYELLRIAGRCGRPVLLKRGFGATVQEWLHAAEYVVSEGNREVILCERGIRTFETSTRSTLDIGAIAVARERTRLPILVDPSHAAGRRELVPALARAAVAAGADGLLVEVHVDPSSARCDGPQSLTIGGFAGLMVDVRAVARAVGRGVAGPPRPLSSITLSFASAGSCESAGVAS